MPNLFLIDNDYFNSGDDLIDNILYDRVFYPDSGIARITTAYYNSLYNEFSKNYSEPNYCEVLECSGEASAETLEDIIDFIGSWAQGKTRRVVRAGVRIACRQALRENVIRTAPDVL